MSEKERERFEAWFRKHYSWMGLSDAELFARTPSGGYCLMPTSNAWLAWRRGGDNQMTEARAREILGDAIREDGLCQPDYIMWKRSWITNIDLTGNFFIPQLKAIIWWVENKNLRAKA